MNETEQKIRIISDLLAPFGKVGSDGKAVLAGYLAAVEHIAPMFVAEAGRRFLTGESKRHNEAFPPSPTELASEARRIFNADRDREQAALPPPAPEPVDEEMRARVSERLAALKDELRPPREHRPTALDLTREEAAEALRVRLTTAKRQGPPQVSEALRTQLI